MKTHVLSIVTIIVLLSSCGIFKKSVKEDVNKYDNTAMEYIKVKTALDSIENNYLKYNSFSAGFSGFYQANNQNLPLKGFLKSKKNDFIWISVRPVLGIEISRIFITTDSIKYIDRLKSEYFSSDYTFFKKKFGFELNFKMIEAILLNKFFTYPSQNIIQNYNLINVEQSTTLSSTGIFNSMNQSHKTSYSKNNYSINKNELKFFDTMQSVLFMYSDFELINNCHFPNSLIVEIKNQNQNQNQNIIINLEYKNIKLNEQVSPSFEIPENYKRINFE